VVLTCVHREPMVDHKSNIYIQNLVYTMEIYKIWASLKKLGAQNYSQTYTYRQSRINTHACMHAHAHTHTNTDMCAQTYTNIIVSKIYSLAISLAQLNPYTQIHSHSCIKLWLPADYHGWWQSWWFHHIINIVNLYRAMEYHKEWLH